MTTAREIMTEGADCIGEDESVLEAARKMTDLGVGALPICGNDDRLKGVLTDRDIVVKVLGRGKDPATCKAGELAQGEAVTIGADDDAQEILRTMREHKVHAAARDRRPPARRDGRPGRCGPRPAGPGRR